MNAKERAKRVRYSLRQNAGDKLRLSVFKSLKHVYAQVVDDANGVTIVSSSTNSKEFDLKKANGVEKAQWVGTEVGKKLIKAKTKGVKIYFDRGAYAYHGKVKALADAARAAGLEF